MLKKAQKGTSATVIAIVTHEWRLRLWLRSSSQNGDRDCDCDCKSCDYDCDCDCDSLSCLWLCANWTTDCDCDSSGDCDPVGTCVFCDYDYSDSAIGSSGVVTATSFFRALINPLPKKFPRLEPIRLILPLRWAKTWQDRGIVCIFYDCSQQRYHQ